MDMLMDREVIRNEALLLLTYLTREAEEIQKIVVFEGAFEKIFSIIKEEGGSDGGVVVQDCIELLNNLIRKNASNQILLRETIGFDPLMSILKLRGSAYSFTQQKTINLLSSLETINLLIMGGSEADPGKDANKLTNKTTLVQKKILDHLLMLGVESQWAPVAVRCAALQCIGNLIIGHSKNLDALASKVLGEGPQEAALNSILRIILRTSSVQEFVAADYVFKSFCEKNADGQTMLASTLIPQPHSMTHAPLEEDVNMSFGSMLLQGLTLSESEVDLETCCRAASVLSHVMKDNIQCKEKVLHIDLEAPTPSLGASEPLMHRVVKYLALSSSMKSKDGKSGGNAYVQPILLKMLVTWLADCPSAVHCFLDSRPHITYLLELVSSSSATVFVKGLAAVLLGECVIYNKSGESGKDAFTVVDSISQKVGLTSYFLKFDEMRKNFLFTSARSAEPRQQLTRSASAGMVEPEDVDGNNLSDQKDEDLPVLSSIFDAAFVNLVKSLEANIREKIVEVYSNPKSKVAVVPAELEQKSGESDGEYVKRLKEFVEKQCSEIQDLLGRNASLAEDVAATGGGSHSRSEQGTGSDRVHVETLRRDLQEASRRLELLKAEKAKIESEASMYKNLAGKMESDLKSLSDAYNSLEQANFQLEKEVRGQNGVGSSAFADVDAIRAQAREEAQKESEAELNDLLVCLGQEQSKVEKLSARLLELGEDVDKLLEDIGDDMGLPGDGEEEED
ncbi:golgin candidate 6 isoform X3 [Rosa chinensis]|nr:golgin candidate 6 isoform X3 [Rosa chinensis]XP_024181103.1 golgin candidate 6 isoform X3 [Rosa chinensis]